MCLCIIRLSQRKKKIGQHAKNSQSNQDLQKSQVGICRPKNSFFQSKHALLQKQKQRVTKHCFPPLLARATWQPSIFREAQPRSRCKLQQSQVRDPLTNPSRGSQQTCRRKASLFVTLLPRGPAAATPLSEAVRRSPAPAPSPRPDPAPGPSPRRRPTLPRGMVCAPRFGRQEVRHANPMSAPRRGRACRGRAEGPGEAGR